MEHDVRVDSQDVTSVVASMIAKRMSKNRLVNLPRPHPC